MSVGDIVVHRGMPPKGNPYRGGGHTRSDPEEPITHVSGDERVSALGAFLRLGQAGEYTFWYAPVCGGAYQLLEPPTVKQSQLDYYWDVDGRGRR